MTLKTIEQYGHPFQIKVISSLLTSKEFLQNIIDVLTDEDFPNSAHKWIIKEIIKYYDKYHTNVSMDVLKVELQKVENEVLQLSIKENAEDAGEAFNGLITIFSARLMENENMISKSDADLLVIDSISKIKQTNHKATSEA